MPKKGSSRRRALRPGSAVGLVVVLAIAALVGWWLLRPVPAPPPRPIARVTSPPATSAPTSAPQPPSPAPSESPTPGSTPTTAPARAPGPASSFAPGAPKVALIIDDCGQWLDVERGFIALDVPLTLAVLPDVRYTGLIGREAANAGKGVMLHLPMETVSGLNPGPGKVTTEMSDAQIEAQVESDLAQVPLARGVNNHEGSKASADPRVMRDVIDVLAKHGNLFFIDSRTSAASVGERIARQNGVPTASRNVFLDNQASVAYTLAALRETAAIAKRTGSAIAIGHPRATTLAAVRQIIPEFQAEGIQLVLAQNLVNR